MAVENKIPNISSVVKKKQTDYITKITKIEKKLTDITMINTLLLHNLISFQQMFLMHDQHIQI